MAMAMGREGEVYGDLMMTRSEISRSPRRVFYDGFQKLLADASFDAFVEETCKPFYAPRRARHSCRRTAISACIRSVIWKGWTASAALSSAARTHGRWEISCDSGNMTRFPIIPGCRRHAATFRMKCMRRFSRSS